MCSDGRESFVVTKTFDVVLLESDLINNDGVESTRDITMSDVSVMIPFSECYTIAVDSSEHFTLPENKFNKQFILLLIMCIYFAFVSIHSRC